MTAVAARSLAVVPSGAALGADVEGIDLARPIEEATFRAIEAAWAEHLVLRFRGQRLDDAALMAFSRRLGPLDRAPIAAAAGPADREKGYVTVISNIVVDGTPIGGLGAYEAVWHTDMSYNERPPIASLLYAIEVPPSGGDTGFTNMYLAYETLPAPLRDEVATLRCKHDASRNSAGELRRGFTEVEDPRETPGALHPIVRTHPVTGRKALFLGRRRNAVIAGLALAESERLLDRLWAHATQPAFTWYQRWREGDLVLWDNRCTMHRRDAFDPATRRLMHRTQVSGEAVLSARAGES
jgi:taurine dioxygenase